MSRTKTCAAAWLAGLSLVVMGSAVLAAEERQEKEPGPAIVLEGGAVGEHATEPPASEYYIGVLAHPANDTLRAQLKLPEGQGVVVAQVMPDSPAAKAKLQPHDVLLRVGDKKLAEATDLIAAVEAAKDKKLVLEVVREGKSMKVEVTPVKRPENMQSPVAGMPPVGDWDATRKWIEQNMPGRPGQPPMRFRIFQPGAVLPPAAPLPGNLSISVSKQGNEPAKIHVQRGDEKWDVNENELDKLPPGVRPHVERMLGRGGVGMGKVQVLSQLPPPQVRSVEQAKPTPNVEKRLDAMNRQIEQLQKSVDDLRKRLPEPKPEPKK